MAASLAHPGWLVAGWVIWTLAEYLLHRYDMHGRRSRSRTRREHILHHQSRPAVPPRSPTSWMAAMLLGALLGWALQPAAGIGWVLGHALYDLQHWAIHARAPRTRYQRFLRRHHLHHHFGNPRRNYGVTVPLWDLLLGTYERPTVVHLPAAAVPWALGGHGTLAPGFAVDDGQKAPTARPEGDPTTSANR